MFVHACTVIYKIQKLLHRVQGKISRFGFSLDANPGLMKVMCCDRPVNSDLYPPCVEVF